MDEASPETWKSFEEFMAGVTAATELYDRAAKMGAFIESVCLGASLVDAALRTGLVLQYQLDNRTRDIPLELILQGPTDKALPEREIYRRALAATVIDDITFAQLQGLYDERNRVIHRYIISRITTADVFDIAVRYEAMHKALMKRLYAIEEQQIRMGVGITVRGPELKDEEGRRFLDEIADDKHTPSLARLLRGS